MYNYKIKVYPDGTEQHFLYFNTVLNGSKKAKEKASNKDSVSRKEIDNQKRARSEVFDLCRSNEFDYFITLTFDPVKVDSFDYDKAVQALKKYTRWLSDNHIQYIMVPEMHQSGRWHFHGLIKGSIKLEQAYNSKTDQPIEGLYNISNYDFGFSTASAIKDQAKVSTYVTKYLSKALNVPKGRKRYWCTKGLLRPIEKTMMVDPDIYVLQKYTADYYKHIKGEYIELHFFEFKKENK